jgi:hypothetical protein
MEYECKECSGVGTWTGVGIYCNKCGTLSYINKKKVNVKNLSNKLAHLGNVISAFKNITEDDYEGLVEFIKKHPDLEKITHRDITAFTKKVKDKNKKIYLIHYLIICFINKENPRISHETIKIITIIFHDFTNFLCKYNKIDITISYQLIIRNIFKLFDINSNFGYFSKSNIKDVKNDLWDKYKMDVCRRMLINEQIEEEKIIQHLDFKHIINKKTNFKFKDYG